MSWLNWSHGEKVKHGLKRKKYFEKTQGKGAYKRVRKYEIADERKRKRQGRSPAWADG